ncbi:unnamed protein product [Spirodela intermedia]|uniref:Uncharacterized protein n=1 Tax=Spirodela intermedia TaxID=51605 RepID=A0A7I8JQ72_SPIIN|nr:unnamed protein product [Spirodela intermedia]CAA6672314.1 unnamed protein product [Spirodela intermedia]
MASSSGMEGAAEERRRRWPPWSSLEGKIVMVTGASSGIGRDFCLDLAAAGCRVVAATRRIDRLESLCAEINAREPPALRAVAVELDVSAEEATIAPAVERAWSAFGRIDSLVNNAGVRGDSRSRWCESPLETPDGEWTNVFATSVTGSWLVAKHVCKLMRDAKLGGSVVNISLTSGISRGQLPDQPRAYNIRVNSISPGIFKSEITEALVKKKWLKDVAAKIIPLKAHGTVDPALTSLLRYLIHDASNYVTGNIFVIDAGAHSQESPSSPLSKCGIISSSL